MVQLVLLSAALTVSSMADSVVKDDHEYSSIRVSSHPAIEELINFPVTTPQGGKTGVYTSTKRGDTQMF